jgi:hypothetical protein
MTRQEIEKLAESAWEGCHHCDENDKNFWMNGFMIGYLNAQVRNIEERIETQKNKIVDSVIKNINKQDEY